MMVNDCEAVIFDMDGVLIDSVVTHGRCWDALAEKHQRYHGPELLEHGNGQTSLSYVLHVLQWTKDPEQAQRYVEEKERIYHDFVAIEGVALVDGVQEFLQRLQAKNVPLAVGTSAPRSNAERVLELAGFNSVFACIITAEDVVHGKPDPEVFLRAAAGLGKPPEVCLVFEDAKAGVQAARAAGMRVIALSTTHPAQELCEADEVHSSFRTVEFDSLLI